MRRLGPKTVPVVARGADYAMGLDLAEVAGHECVDHAHRHVGDLREDDREREAPGLAPLVQDIGAIEQRAEPCRVQPTHPTSSSCIVPMSPPSRPP